MNILYCINRYTTTFIFISLLLFRRIPAFTFNDKLPVFWREHCQVLHAYAVKACHQLKIRKLLRHEVSSNYMQLCIHLFRNIYRYLKTGSTEIFFTRLSAFYLHIDFTLTWAIGKILFYRSLYNMYLVISWLIIPCIIYCDWLP
jgi:hypothetical protein